MTQLRNTSNKAPDAGKARDTRDIPTTPVSPSLFARFEQPGRWTTGLIALLLFLVAMGFNLYQIGAPSIWFDEALSVTRAQQSLPVLFKIVSVTQPNMALYYFVLHFWLSFMSLFGLHATEAVVRFPLAVSWQLIRSFSISWLDVSLAQLSLFSPLSSIYSIHSN